MWLDYVRKDYYEFVNGSVDARMDGGMDQRIDLCLYVPIQL